MKSVEAKSLREVKEFLPNEEIEERNNDYHDDDRLEEYPVLRIRAVNTHVQPDALLLDVTLRVSQNDKTAAGPVAGATRWNSRGSGRFRPGS